jgi:hypothetical protein
LCFYFSAYHYCQEEGFGFNVQLAQTKISGENTMENFFNLLHGIIAFGSLAHPPRLALQTWNCPYLLA